jgi:hypothetical protein
LKDGILDFSTVENKEDFTSEFIALSGGETAYIPWGMFFMLTCTSDNATAITLPVLSSKAVKACPENVLTPFLNATSDYVLSVGPPANAFHAQA